DELGMRPLQAHCHRSLGTLYAKTDQREQARIELSIAIEMYRAMEMTFWLPQTEAALARVSTCDNATAGSNMERESPQGAWLLYQIVSDVVQAAVGFRASSHGGRDCRCVVPSWPRHWLTRVLMRKPTTGSDPR